MRVLLDTQVFLWLHSEPERVGNALPLLEDAMTMRLVSPVVGWEISIKHSLGRLELPASPDRWVPDKLEEGAMTPIAIELSHVLAVGSLPLHHRDPFDRLLVAQARLLDVPLVSADPVFERYDVALIAV